MILSWLLWLLLPFVQAPSLEGPWYGTINAPGSQVEIGIDLQKSGDTWIGTLVIEGGRRVALQNITTQGNVISFSVALGKEGRFTGTVSGDPSSISGEFLQGDLKFPFKLSRNLTPRLQGGAVAIDANELLEMMTQFSGSLSDRPFVPPLTHPAVGYPAREAGDPVAKLNADLQEGKTRLAFQGEDGYLRSLLDALHIPVESQVAVFSKNSLQRGIISPENPRTLYFNDSVAVGWVRGGFLELAAHDPERGVNFYMMPQEQGVPPFIVPRSDCLQCHISRNSMDVPGMLMRSIYPARDGTPINPLGSYLLDHRTKFEERWGGWYVTGDTGAIKHMGNRVISDPANPDSTAPLSEKKQSDVVALMVFEHQMHMMNLITRVGWEFRVAAALEEATGKRNNVIEAQLREATSELVDYLLFIDEPLLPGKVKGTSGFAEKFEAQGPNDSKGRSLRQFDLEQRLMRYRCSYMIYSPAFEALRGDAKKAIYDRMREVMASRFSAEDRQAVTEILKETRKDF